MVWDTEILDYQVNPANQYVGADRGRRGRCTRGRSCDPRGGPNGCVITAHDAATGEELWRRRGCIPARRGSRATRRGATSRSSGGLTSAHGWCRATIRS